jgi:hypothetical protein
MCIYHLHQKELAAAFFNYRKQLRADRVVTCDCKRENIKDEFVLRKNLTCPRPEDQEFDDPKCYNKIVVVANDDPEHGAQEPFFIGQAAALYDGAKAGENGITYTWELGDQETTFGKMCNDDVVLDIIKYEPVKVGSNLYERATKRFPVYVENTCVRNVRLEAVDNKVKLAQGESNRILLAVPRETWFYREMSSRPWDPRLVKASDTEYIMQVSQQLLNKSLCPSLRVLSFFRVVHLCTVPSAIY